jgi:hypothetical protein
MTGIKVALGANLNFLGAAKQLSCRNGDKDTNREKVQAPVSVCKISK